MSQRLVITISSCGEDIAKLYYSWSAYPVSALVEAQELIEALETMKNECNIEKLKLNLVRFCEKNGGGINGGKGSSEWQYIQSLYPDESFKEENISASQGLITLSPYGMNRMQSFSEGDMAIDIDNKTIYNYVLICYDGISEFNNWHRELADDDWIDLSLAEIPEIDHDAGQFHFSDIGYILAKCKEHDIVRYNETIYECYE